MSGEHGAWQCPRCIVDMVQGGVLHHEPSNRIHALRFGLMIRGPGCPTGCTNGAPFRLSFFWFSLFSRG